MAGDINSLNLLVLFSTNDISVFDINCYVANPENAV